MNITSKKLKMRNYLAYGAGDLYGGGAFFIVTTFSMYYLVNVMGMHPVLAGLIPALGKIWDGISDPLMGYIADNTKLNRFGKRRVWFLVSVIPIAVSFILIWFPVSLSSQMGKFFYFLFAYIFFFTVATVSYVPYAALSAEMTFDPKERNILNGTRIFFSFIATLLGGVLVKPIIDLYDGNKTGYFVMSIVFALIFSLPWITLYLGTWELPQKTLEKEKTHFMTNFFSLFKNKSCRIHVTMYVCSFGAMDLFMAWIMFYFNDYLRMSSSFVIAQGALLLTMMAALPFYVKIATKRGHGKAYELGLSIFLSGLLLLGLHPPETNRFLLILNVILLGSGLAAGSLIPHQLLPFVVDVDRLMSGKERAGTYSAVMTLTRKLFLGIIILQGLGFLLGAINYKNPLPTLLSDYQYEEARTLFMDEGIDENGRYLLANSYVEDSEGNWSLDGDEKEYYRLREILDRVHYPYTGIGNQKQLIQKEDTVRKLRFFFILFPSMMCLIGILTATKLKLDPVNHKIVVDEIKRLEDGGRKEDADEQLCRVFKILTGHEYLGDEIV